MECLLISWLFIECLCLLLLYYSSLHYLVSVIKSKNDKNYFIYLYIYLFLRQSFTVYPRLAWRALFSSDCIGSPKPPDSLVLGVHAQLQGQNIYRTGRIKTDLPLT